MSYAFLVADKREREVIPHLKPILERGAFKSKKCKDAAKGASGLVEHTIHTGDYLLCRRETGSPESKIVACFERKSIKDFVSSIGDGRHENKRKMMELREKTGCQLYYIIEGKAFASPDWAIGGKMKYRTIMTAMVTMPLFSGIHILQTKDTKHTAERLRDFVVELNQEAEPYVYPLGISYCGGSEDAASAQPNDLSNQTAPNLTTTAGTGVPEIVTGVYEKDPDTLCMEMWSKLPGISITTSKIIVEMCSLREFMNRVGPRVEDIKTSTGRKLQKKASEALFLLQNGDPSIGVKILSGVSGVSTDTAAQIMEQIAVPAGHEGGKLRILCNMSVAVLSEFTLKQKSRSVRLGAKKARTILRILRWKTGNDGESAAQEASAAAPASAHAVATPTPLAQTPEDMEEARQELDDIMNLL